MIWGMLDPHPTYLHFLGEDPGLKASSAEEEMGPGNPGWGVGTVGEERVLEGSLSPSQSQSPSPPHHSSISPPILGPGMKGMASTHLEERRHWVLIRYSGEPDWAWRLDVPHPVGD